MSPWYRAGSRAKAHRRLAQALGPPLALALAVALALPLAAAHLDHDRAHVQAFEGGRRVEATMAGTAARVDLLASDPLRDLVRHEIDPARGTIAAEYRSDPSVASSAFRARWTIVRVLEYGDTSGNGVFDEGMDPVSRSWKPSSYAWNVTPPDDVFIGGVTAKAMAWNGTASGAPGLRLVAGFAGTPMRDEGARALPQDGILYLDLSGFPPRGVGHLYAIEGKVSPPSGTEVAIDASTVNNQTVQAGLRVEAKDRLVVLDWGAQATLDGTEQLVNVTLGPADASGNRTFVLHFPRFDESLHMVIVTGVEYVLPTRTTVPMLQAPLLLAAIAAIASTLRILAGPPESRKLRKP